MFKTVRSTLRFLATSETIESFDDDCIPLPSLFITLESKTNINVVENANNDLIITEKV